MEPKEDVTRENRPSGELLEAEYNRVRYRNRFLRVMRNTLLSLLVVAAVAVLIVVLVLPVLKISGTSMEVTLMDGDIVVATKTKNYKPGDVVAFYYNNSILIKRVIGSAGDWVDMDETGNVYVNGQKLDEPYVTDKALGECNITFPYQVPDDRYFVMGDHRATSIDSRTREVGCIGEDMVVGRLFFRVWPLSGFGLIH